MKLFSTLAVTAFAAVSTALNAAEVIDLMSKDFWRSNANVQFTENGISTKRVLLHSKKPITLDPTKKYTWTMTVGASDNEKPSLVLYGFSPATENGRAIAAVNIQTCAGTFTEVIEAAKKGDKTIKVKDASKWTNSASAAVAINAKEDYSDLPNFKVFISAVESKVKDGDAWVITFKKPLNMAIPAGTFIRQHMQGGYLYVSSRTIPNGKSATVKHTVTGQAPQGLYNIHKGFMPAMKKAYIVILVDWTNSQATVNIKDAKLTIE